MQSQEWKLSFSLELFYFKVVGTYYTFFTDILLSGLQKDQRIIQ